MVAITLPGNNWRPRAYQHALWRYLENGGKRAIVICHRRWGKDDVGLHWSAVSSQLRPGNIFYLLPEYSQARKVVWSAVNPHTGMRRIDEAFPPELRETQSEQEMFVRFKNGATVQLVGSDRYDSLVGSPPVGVVFSEWALSDPKAWGLLAPILMENDGWALFLTTPRGRNHAFSMYQNAKANPDWFAVQQTVDDTSVFAPEALETTRKEYIALYGEDEGEALFQQEFYCSFEAAIMGSYYGRELALAENQGRITSVPYNPSLPVYTAWDLGIDDCTAVWFAQIAGREVRLIDYFETSGEGLEGISRYILTEKRYTYAAHHLPHDVMVREMISGTTRKATLESLGLRPIIAGKMLKLPDGINAARNLIAKCVFDGARCRKGLEALTNYHREWDEAARTYRQQPKHDWSSHGADAFRELAVNLTDRSKRKTEVTVETCASYDPLSGRREASTW